MDPVMKPFGDDQDLDALMVRVREAALTVTNGATPRPNAAGAADDAGVDLVGVLDAQAASNEELRQSLAALVECLQTLRDDWSDAHARLQEEVRQLSALVTGIGSGKALPAPRRRTASQRRPAKARRRQS